MFPGGKHAISVIRLCRNNLTGEPFVLSDDSLQRLLCVQGALLLSIRVIHLYDRGRFDLFMAPKKPVPSPNFLTCPIEPVGSEVPKAPAPNNIPFEKISTKKEVAASAARRSLPHDDKSWNSAHPSSPLDRAIPRVDGHQPPRGSSKKAVANEPRRPHIMRWVVVALIVLIAAATGPAVYALVRAGIAAQSAKSAITRAMTGLQRSDFDTANQGLHDARVGLTDAHDALKGVGFWRDVPGIGTQVRALEDAASAGAATVDGLEDLFGVATEVLDAAASVSAATGELVNPVEAHRSFNDLTPEEKRAILARLDRSLPDIRSAQAKVTVALETWNRIPQDSLFSPLKKAFQPVAENLPRLKQSLDEAVPLLEVFIPLAGYPEPADYLVLLQNSDEMRATGGFVGTWGVLHMDGGDLETFEFNDVYALDNPASGVWKEVPPAPIRDRLGVPAWFFRDANWSPDFPTSAMRLSDFYVRETKAGTGKDVKMPSGVIALNQPFFEGLLRMTGPITIDGVTFTADNFFDELEFEVEQRFLEKGISQDDRKQILLKLGDALLAKLTSLPAARWPDLLDLATRSLERKDIQMYARNPALLARLDAFGWTGRTKPTNGDFLWVIDSNLAALKTDGVMQKRVSYTVDAKDPEQAIATVTLRYTNDGPGIGKDFRYTRYRDYVRLYVPEGAELIEVNGAMKDDRYRTGGRVVPGSVDVFKDLGKTVFGAFWSIEPKTTQEITFKYRLPHGVADQLTAGNYRLDIPKQSGNDGVALTLDLRFGKKLQRAMPAEEPAQFGDNAYKVESDAASDRAFEITF